MLLNAAFARMTDNEVRMPAGQDAYTVAKLMESQARIAQAMDVQLSRAMN